MLLIVTSTMIEIQLVWVGANGIERNNECCSAVRENSEGTYVRSFVRCSLRLASLRFATPAKRKRVYAGALIHARYFARRVF